MTARHNIRIANRRLSRDRSAIDATPAPSVGEMLQNARERKGVDLFRAERDTKIRLKYLAALEDSDYDALPPLVYTKGFLRNYAIYLGLDPEDILARWRDETQVGRKQERPAVAPPPHRHHARPARRDHVQPGRYGRLCLDRLAARALCRHAHPVVDQPGRARQYRQRRQHRAFRQGRGTR